MAARRRFRPTVRRKMIWARSQDLQFGTPGTPLPAVGVATDLLANFRADGGSSLGSTVTRVRLSLTLDWIWTSAPSVQDQLAVGVLVDQRQANQAEVPRPGVEEHADWMLWKRFGIVPAMTALPTSSGTATRYQVHHEFDVQSQRKMEELDQTLWLILDPTYASAGAGLPSVLCNASVLLKLP